MTKIKNKFSKSISLSQHPVLKRTNMQKIPDAPPVSNKKIPDAPPTPVVEKKTENKKERVLTNPISLDDVREYIEINENHLKEIENQFSFFIRKDDILDVKFIHAFKKLKEDLDDVREKINKIEDRPFVPPLSLVSNKSTGKIIGRIDELESVARKLQEQIDRERYENIETNTCALKTFDVISKNMEKLKESLDRISERSKKQTEWIEDESSGIKRDAEQISVLKKIIDNLGIEDIVRNIESIKIKNQWIEQNIQEIDIKPLYEKIEELEHRIETLRVSSPYILE